MKKIVKLFIAIIIGLISIDALFIINSINDENNNSNNNNYIAYETTNVNNTSVINKETTTTVRTGTKTTTYTITTTKVQEDTKVDGIGTKINGATDKYLNKLNTKLNNVPTKLLNVFIKEGWVISVTGENLAETHFNGKYSSVQGLTNYNEKYILIEDRDNAINESTVHEFGHFFDYYLGFISSSDEFKNIYNEEVNLFKSNISNSDCVRNEREFFAETFYYMYTDSSKCTTNAYNYINNLINNL